MPDKFDFKDFDNMWSEMGKEICQVVYTHPAAQKIKNTLQHNGFLTMDEKSEFINLCDRIKYEVIYSKVGAENSQGYKDFSAGWEQWFQQKGVGSSQNRGQRNSVEHILFGSTPDPAAFLLHYEEETLGSKQNKK
jgi:hypothetical protein